jgi:2-oxoglutarate ferredoxin oxidoreductase subunit gamma
MNLPSLKKYENDVVSGGIIIVDSALIAEKVERDDVTTYYVPATKMANDEGFATLANMILMGKLMKVCENIGFDGTETVLSKVVPPKKANLIEVNLKALKTGYDFE